MGLEGISPFLYFVALFFAFFGGRNLVFFGDFLRFFVLHPTTRGE